jgi:phosphatidylglycerol:prolipoprotein diacylglycerol transferase
MYPNLYYAFKDLFGIELPLLKAINSVGFFIAIAFIPGAWLWRYELKRKERTGELRSRIDTIVVGTPASIGLITLHLILGFLGGFKLIGIAFSATALTDTQAYFFSSQGSWTAGILLGAAWAFFTWYEAKKDSLPIPQTQKVEVFPHEYVARGILVAAISGVIGAKIFGVFENWDLFIQAPFKYLFSAVGFAFLGGLIVATFAMWFYHYKWTVQRMRMADALAPSLLLSYSLGRIGCQIGGDGDWGINNLSAKPFSWIPNWLWAYDYPHNVLKKGIYMQGCTWDDYCYRLPVPVFPTPLYELIGGLLLFALLMLVRKRLKMAGYVSALYLLLTAFERFFIEKIRVDVRYSFLGLHPTQAEILSIFLFIAGVVLYFIAPKLNANKIQ